MKLGTLWSKSRDLTTALTIPAQVVENIFKLENVEKED